MVVRKTGVGPWLLCLCIVMLLSITKRMLRMGALGIFVCGMAVFLLVYPYTLVWWLGLLYVAAQQILNWRGIPVPELVFIPAILVVSFLVKLVREKRGFRRAIRELWKWETVEDGVIATVIVLCVAMVISLVMVVREIDARADSAWPSIPGPQVPKNIGQLSPHYVPQHTINSENRFKHYLIPELIEKLKVTIDRLSQLHSNWSVKNQEIDESVRLTIQDGSHPLNKERADAQRKDGIRRKAHEATDFKKAWRNDILTACSLRDEIVNGASRLLYPRHNPQDDALFAKLKSDKYEWADVDTAKASLSELLEQLEHANTLPQVKRP